MRISLVVSTIFALGCGHVFAQTAGDSMSLEYGTVSNVDQVQAKSRHARGALIGGVAGAAIAHNNRGLGALAGGLIGASIEGHNTGNNVLQEYTISLRGGGIVVIDTEQRDIARGDCVVVEQGKYTNIRRVSMINCQVDQKPGHHVSAAGHCKKAKDELSNAKTKEDANLAVTKIRTLCED